MRLPPLPKASILRGAVSAAVLGSLFVAAPARAAEPKEASRPDFAFGHPEAEATLLGLTGAANFTYLIPPRVAFWSPFRARPFDSLVSKVSDMTGAIGGSFLQLGLGFVFETSYLYASGVSIPGAAALHEFAVESESLLLTSAVTGLIKNIAGRCRPRAYFGLDKPCRERDAFPSGHTSAIASFSGARFVNLVQTPLNEAFALRFSALLTSEVATAVTGVLRIWSGSHSWEDVLAGAAIGHATGITIALLHPRVTLRDGEPYDDDAAAAAAPLTARNAFFSWSGSF